MGMMRLFAAIQMCQLNDCQTLQGSRQCLNLLTRVAVQFAPTQFRVTGLASGWDAYACTTSSGHSALACSNKYYLVSNADPCSGKPCQVALEACRLS